MFKRYIESKYNHFNFMITTVIFILIGLICFCHYFDIYVVSNKSMEDTILEGDWILVKKIDKICLTKSVNIKSRKYFNSIMIVENIGDNLNRRYIKRCIGLPGDTLSVFDGKIFNNHVEIPLVGSSRMLFVIWSKSYEELYEYANKNNIRIVRKNKNLSEINASIFKINELLQKKIITNYEIANKEKLCLFNSEVLYIPKNNDLIISLNGSKVGTYFSKMEKNSRIVNENYYFLFGDNRDNSMDSRTWGVIPESYIIGEAKMILFSKGSKKSNYNYRFFRTIKKPIS